MYTRGQHINKRINRIQVCAAREKDVNSSVMPTERIGRSALAGRIEPFILDLLEREQYVADPISATELLTWNRLDLAFKLLFLELKDRHPRLASQIYREDIRSQTLGTFTEHENETKNTFEKYVSAFQSIEKSILDEGFDSQRSLVPVSSTGAIFNGAHRVASAIRANADVWRLQTELPIHVCDYRFYQSNGVATKFIEMAVRRYINQAHGVYLAFLWPSGISKTKQSESLIPNIVYRRTLPLSLNGGRNLLFELYKHMDWIGSKRNGYSGIEQKLAECFPKLEEVTVVAFQAPSIDAVRAIKEQIRKVHDIGFSSIHITDTKEEAVRISELVFNENGVHFLNHAKPHRYDKGELDEFESFVRESGLATEDVVIDGSYLLSLYGLRPAHDIDFLSYESVECSNSTFDTHDDQLKFHAAEKVDLLFDPEYHFNYCGLKFVSFRQLRRMKANRNEIKDRYDVAAMASALSRQSIWSRLSQVTQRVFFFQLRTKTTLRIFVVLLLKRIGLYSAMRRYYWTLMK